jgi:hypothetical protein
MDPAKIDLPQIDPELGEIRQIAYIVDDIDAAMKDWQENRGVGAFAIARKATPLRNAYYRGERSETIVIDVAFGYLGDLQVELIELKEIIPSMYKEAMDRGQKDLQHYGVTVDDFQAACDHAKANGFTSVVDAGFEGLARMSYLEATDLEKNVFSDPSFMKTPEGHGIVLEIIEWNALTRPYFDAIEELVAQVPTGSFVAEFDLGSITPVGEVLKMLPRFLFKKLLGRT